MIELLYGSKDFDRIAWREIDQGRPVSIRIARVRKAFIHRLLSLYAHYDQELRKGRNRRDLLFSFGWRGFFAPALIGICNHARLAGMEIVVMDQGSTLEVRFQKPAT
jgi:hypothetical protein